MKYYIIILCLALIGCEESISKVNLIKQNSDGSYKLYEQKFSNDTQIFETVSYANIISWIKSHPHIHIDTMALVTFGNGYAEGYIVVYRELNPNKVER